MKAEGLANLPIIVGEEPQLSHCMPSSFLNSSIAPPKVSVAMITYNHEPYIEQAIQSALDQRMDFAFEIVIGDDCSTDGTQLIVRRLADQYRDKIRLLSSERNLGAGKNFARVLKACRGSYIALLEGDDYWTSSDKLAKQVNFLAERVEYVACFHWAAVQENMAGILPGVRRGPVSVRAAYSMDDLFEYNNFIPTASIMFRGECVSKLPVWFFDLPIGDLALHVLNARLGKIGFLNETMSVYRLHPGGAFTGQTRLRQLSAIISTYRALADQLEFRLRPSLRRGLAFQYSELSWEYRSQRRIGASLMTAAQAIRWAPGWTKATIAGRFLRVAVKRVSERLGVGEGNSGHTTRLH